MNAYLNYLLEASIGLCLFLLVYQLLLRKETNFRLNRIFLLVAIIASVTFPLLKLNTIASPVPSLNFSVTVPEMEQLTPIPTNTIPEGTQPTMNTWQIIANLYVAGLVIFFTLFVIRLTKIIKALRQSPKYKFSNHNIVELKGDQSPFSFFNYIFISSSSPITENEKKQILEHEAIHAKLYHSIDIVLLNAVGIVFWFNPIVRYYKKIFIQLHEFEADARAVEKHDVNEYCSLVAKVALQSANFKLANHFSNSLTIKRIEMMRTLKHKIKSWKLIAVAACLPILFVVVACQDQVEQIEVAEEVELMVESKYPANVQQVLDNLKTNFPKRYYKVMGPDVNMPETLKSDREMKRVVFQGIIWITHSHETISAKDKGGNAVFYLIMEPMRTRKITPEEQEKLNAKFPNEKILY